MNKTDEQLTSELQKFRGHQAFKNGIEPFKVFTNAQMADIISVRPTTLKSLSAIKGIGPKKLEYYGEGILKILNGSIGASSAFGGK